MAEPSPLSEREQEIMDEVVTGLSNREIAKALDISPNTVKVHLRNIYEKLGVASRTEATLVVLREGWITVEGVAAVFEEEELPEESEPVYGMPPSPPVNGAEADTSPLALQTPAPALLPATRPVLRPEVIIERPARGIPGWVALLLGSLVVALLLVLTLLLLRPDTVVAPDAATTSESTRWVQLARLPAPRADAAVVSLSHGFLLVGGEAEGGVSDEVWRYDPATGRWESAAPLLHAVNEAPVASLRGELFVVGGAGESGQPLDVVQRFDPETEQWQEGSRLPQPLARAALAAFEGDLFLFGGWDGDTVQDNIYRYDSAGEAWELLGQLPAPRADLTATAVQDGIVLIGGTDQAGNATGEVLHFDPREPDRLRNEAPLPQPIAAPRVVTLGSALYLLGDGTLFVRDPDQQWRQLSAPQETLPARAALVASDPYIITLGGTQDGALVPTVWQYQAIYRSFIPIGTSGE